MVFGNLAILCLISDDAFFNRIGLERVGVVGSEPRLLWTGLKALDRRAGYRTTAGLVCKNKKEGGSAGASPVAAPMPKSVPH